MEEMLLIAKADLDTARILYKKKEYTNALYHYHQCVEKVVKFIGLSTGKISEEQLSKEIRHDPIKVFKSLLDYASEQLIGILPTIDKHLFTNARQIVDSKSEEFIVDLVKTTIRSICNEKKIIDEKKYPSHFDAVCDYISKVLPEFDLGLSNLAVKQYTEIRLKNQVEIFLFFTNYGIKILQILLMHTLICSKFKPDDFRYSNPKIGNPVEYFNKNNPFIKELPYLMKSMKLPMKYAGQINWSQNM